MASTEKKNVISSLIETGKAKGKLSTKDITDALEELDYDVEQVDKLYSMLEGQNIEIVEEGDDGGGHGETSFVGRVAGSGALFAKRGGRGRLFGVKV